MTTRSIETRLRKLEQARRPDGIFFMAWSDRALSDALASGMVSHSDTIVRGTWPGVGEPPASRWIGKGGLSAAEQDALSGDLERCAGAEGVCVTHMPSALDGMSDERLVAVALGGPA